jgi:hypothetical protein
MRSIYFHFSILTASLAVWQASGAQTESNHWGAVTNNLQMCIALEDGIERKVSEPLNLMILYRNVGSNETFQIYQVNGTVSDPSYSFTITSPSGKDISPDLTKLAAFSGQVHGLEPGKIVEIRFPLSKVCKVVELGSYEIVARKEVWSDSKGARFQVVSNRLRVNIGANR